MPFFQQKEIQKVMERVLYIWAIRHPASSYVQGMNDLLTPLLLVAMHPHAHDVLRCDCATLDPQVSEYDLLLHRLYIDYTHLWLMTVMIMVMDRILSSWFQDYSLFLFHQAHHFFFSIANFSSFSYSSLKVLLDVEADSYWCLTKLMDNIQDRYTFSQVAWYPYCHCPYLPLHQKISRLGNC